MNSGAEMDTLPKLLAPGRSLLFHSNHFREFGPRAHRANGFDSDLSARAPSGERQRRWIWIQIKSGADFGFAWVLNFLKFRQAPMFAGLVLRTMFPKAAAKTSELGTDFGSRPWPKKPPDRGPRGVSFWHLYFGGSYASQH